MVMGLVIFPTKHCYIKIFLTLSAWAWLIFVHQLEKKCFKIQITVSELWITNIVRLDYNWQLKYESNYGLNKHCNWVFSQNYINNTNILFQWRSFPQLQRMPIIFIVTSQKAVSTSHANKIWQEKTSVRKKENLY